MKKLIVLFWVFSPFLSLAGISGSSGGPSSALTDEIRYKFEVCHGEANTNCREVIFKIKPSPYRADKKICVTSFGDAGLDIPCANLKQTPRWIQKLLDEIKK